MEVIVSDIEKAHLLPRKELENKIILLGKKIVDFYDIKDIYITKYNNRTFI